MKNFDVRQISSIDRMRRRRSCVASSSPTEAAADWPARTDRSRLRGWRQALPRRSGKRIRRQLDRNCACGARTFDFNSARGFRIVRGAFRVCVVSCLLGCSKRRPVIRTHRQKNLYPASKASRSPAGRRPGRPERGCVYGVGRHCLHAGTSGGSLGRCIAD